MLRKLGIAAALALSLGRLAHADCPAGELLGLDGVVVQPPSATAAIPGSLRPEGTLGGELLDDAVLVDLSQVRTVRALLVQADAAADLRIEASVDGRHFRPLVHFPSVAGDGLRARSSGVLAPVELRFLRLSSREPARLSALHAWCQPPERPESIDARVRRQRSAVQLARALIGAAGCLLLAWRVWRPPRLPSVQRIADVPLAVLGLLAIAAWWNFGLFHFGRYVHDHDQFHYFLGGKYFRELGYTRLYECVTVADLEDAPGSRAHTRSIRDMESNALVSTAALVADPGICKRRFTTERWEQFRRDVAQFREAIPGERWERLFRDHGFNAPPAWVLLGGLLTGGLEATRTNVFALALIDPLLLLAMWALVVHAFGWRVAAVAALWWGTNRFADFGWTGGGLLRQDWLFLAVVGICLVRRGRNVLGGFALGWSALLRVFPAMLLGGLALQLLARAIAVRRLVLGRDALRIGAGVLLAFGLLVPASCAGSGGVESWIAFLHEARANLRSTGTNMVGLMAPLTYEPAQSMEAVDRSGVPDPEAHWLEAKRDIHARRTALHLLLAAAFALLLAFAVRAEPPWAALALGVGLVPVVGFVASYYCSIFLVFGLLAARRGPAVGAWLCALSVATHVVTAIWPEPVHMDTRFAVASAIAVAVILAITLGFARRVNGSEPAQPW